MAQTAWCEIADVEAEPGCAGTDATDAQITSAILAASEACFIRSGRQFSQRTVTVRPCARPFHGDAGRPPPGWDVSWGTVGAAHQGWCRCVRPFSTTCSCSAGASEIRLGLGPLLDVQQVKIDGAVISPADYETQEADWLVYLADADGRRRTWPTTQRLDLPDTEEDTWSIQALVGDAVPELGSAAAAELACKLLGYRTEECAETNVTAKTRQGVSYEFISLSEALQASLTGCPTVDLFVATYNPARLQRRSRLLWPLPQRVRRTDTVGT